ncbi:hypothetical protein J6590_025542 [Homalodisca vitripennis]|nr:hypothetical protein J6590_025542 [Homalodisca vitripennis]
MRMYRGIGTTDAATQEVFCSRQVESPDRCAPQERAVGGGDFFPSCYWPAGKYLHDTVSVIHVARVWATLMIHDSGQGIQASQACLATIAEHLEKLEGVGVHHQAAEPHPIFIFLTQILFHVLFQQINLWKIYYQTTVEETLLLQSQHTI